MSGRVRVRGGAAAIRTFGRVTKLATPANSPYGVGRVDIRIR